MNQEPQSPKTPINTTSSQNKVVPRAPKKTKAKLTIGEIASKSPNRNQITFSAAVQAFYSNEMYKFDLNFFPNNNHHNNDKHGDPSFSL